MKRKTSVRSVRSIIHKYVQKPHGGVFVLKLIYIMSDTDKQAVLSDNKPQRDERGRLLPGNTANPNGRPIETPEDKAIKKATNKIVGEYTKKLTEALPQISPVLIRKATKGDGDIVAIKEIHDRVMGKPKATLDIGIDDDLKEAIEKINQTLP